MAKKKGNRKGSGKKKPQGKKSRSKNRPPAKKKPQSKKVEVLEEPVVEPEEIIEEPVEEIPTEVTIEEPEKAEPELSDAVAEVLGKKKDSKKIPKKYKTSLLKYQSDGLDTAELEDLMENASLKKIRDGFKAFENGLKQIEEIKNALEEMELIGLDDEVEELTRLLSSPRNSDEALAKFEKLKFKQQAVSIHTELDKMVLPTMKDKVDSMKARLDAMEDLKVIEEDMKDLRREYKEAYAEDGVMAHVTTEEAADRKSTRLNSSHTDISRMPSSA